MATQVANSSLQLTGQPGTNLLKDLIRSRNNRAGKKNRSRGASAPCEGRRNSKKNKKKNGKKNATNLVTTVNEVPEVVETLPEIEESLPNVLEEVPEVVETQGEEIELDSEEIHIPTHDEAVANAVSIATKILEENTKKSNDIKCSSVQLKFTANLHQEIGAKDNCEQEDVVCEFGLGEYKRGRILNDGHGDSSQISQLACDRMVSKLEEPLSNMEKDGTLRENFVELISRVEKEINSEVQGMFGHQGSTLHLMWIGDNHIYNYHLGDCRSMACKDGTIYNTNQEVVDLFDMERNIFTGPCINGVHCYQGSRDDYLRTKLQSGLECRADKLGVKISPWDCSYSPEMKEELMSATPIHITEEDMNKCYFPNDEDGRKHLEWKKLNYNYLRSLQQQVEENLKELPDPSTIKTMFYDYDTRIWRTPCGLEPTRSLEKNSYIGKVIMNGVVSIWDIKSEDREGLVLWGNTDGLEDNDSLTPEEVAILLTGDYSKWNEISKVRQKVMVDLTSHSLLPANPGIKPEDIENRYIWLRDLSEIEFMKCRIKAPDKIWLNALKRSYGRLAELFVNGLEGLTWEERTEAIVHLAISKGSCDNTSVYGIRFD